MVLLLQVLSSRGITQQGERKLFFSRLEHWGQTSRLFHQELWGEHLQMEVWKAMQMLSMATLWKELLNCWTCWQWQNEITDYDWITLEYIINLSCQLLSLQFPGENRKKKEENMPVYRVVHHRLTWLCLLDLTVRSSRVSPVAILWLILFSPHPSPNIGSGNPGILGTVSRGSGVLVCH